MSRERPILWSAPMVLALLAGRKLQTRRIVKPAHLSAAGGRPFGWGTLDAEHGITERVRCPYGQPGDRLWGRETFGATDLTLDDKHLPGIHYRATDDWPQRGPWPWRPSIFMPRWASRLLHEVAAVRVERLQDISEADAIAEGFEPMIHESWSVWDPASEATVSLMVEPTQAEIAKHGYEDVRHVGPKTISTARELYLQLWDNLNGPESWAANPWVWVISFRPVQP